MKKFLEKFSIYHLVVISLMAAIGIAVKSVIVPLVHIVTSSLFIPGGALAGGIYMLFIVLSAGICGKVGAGTITGLTQGIMVIIAGISGSHGIISLLTYTMPGVAVDLVFMIALKKDKNILHFVFACIAANITGSMLVSMVFFQLPLIPFLFSAALASFSGALGGIIAWQIYQKLKKVQLA